jgi:hypothetical protein
MSVCLGKKECSCRKWLLTGLPCVHAICCIREMELDMYDFVPDEYRKEKHEACYRHIIYPVNGRSLWERTRYTDLQPPPIKRQPGRPKKKRNKDPSELLRDDSEMKRARNGIKCSICKQFGHNKSTCKLPPPPPPPPTENQPESQSQTTSANQPTATTTVHIQPSVGP